MEEERAREGGGGRMREKERERVGGGEREEVREGDRFHIVFVFVWVESVPAGRRRHQVWRCPCLCLC